MSKPRIPTEFRYWEQLETPYAKALRQLLRAVFGVEPRLPDEAVRKKILVDNPKVLYGF